MSQVPFQKGRLTVPTEPIPWPSDRKERVSVNGFGIGGANAHVSPQNGQFKGRIAHFTP